MIVKLFSRDFVVYLIFGLNVLFVSWLIAVHSIWSCFCQIKGLESISSGRYVMGVDGIFQFL